MYNIQNRGYTWVNEGTWDNEGISKQEGGGEGRGVHLRYFFQSLNMCFLRLRS